MIVLEFKTYPNQQQILAIEEAIRITKFLRNKCLRYWEDNQGIKPYDLNKYTAVLAKEFKFADKLNSMARQASAERAAFAISRFFANCKSKKPGKKAPLSGGTGAELFPPIEVPCEETSPRKKRQEGYPKYQKINRSVEYKTCGWKLSECKKYITFTDKLNIGKLKLKGTIDLNFYQENQIKRVRIIRRSDGYYIQLCLDVERKINHDFTGNVIAIDLGLEVFYSDSNGNHVENPRKLRKAEKRLKRLHKLVSRKKKGSKNRKKAINRLGRQHLKVSRRRKDHSVKTAGALVKSNDLVVYENIKIKNLLKNRKLAKSISDASWSIFTNWIDYYAKLHSIVCVAVPPNYTSQDCSVCGKRVKKTLSQRTHKCDCGCELQRDVNAAKNILAKGLEMLGAELPNTVGQTEINAHGETPLYLSLETEISKVSRRSENPRTS
jgi:putative transposase